MREGTKTALLEEERLDEGIIERAIAVAETAPPADRVRTGLEVAVAEAESDPAAARAALHELRADHRRLGELEAWLGGDPDRATFGLGAAIQIADAELAAPNPDLASLVPELARWLEGDW
jgi:hypothetical protein